MKRFERFELEVARCARHQRDHVIDGLGRIAQCQFQAVDEAAQEGCDMLGMLGGKLRIDDDGMAVKGAAEIRISQHQQIGCRDAAVAKVDCGRE